MARHSNSCVTAPSTLATTLTRDPSPSSSATSSEARWAGRFSKDKLFLFGNYEGFGQTWGLSAVTLVPDDQARQGYLPNQSGAEKYVGVDAAVAPLLACGRCRMGPNLGERHRRGLQSSAAAHSRGLWNRALRRQPQQQGSSLRGLHRQTTAAPIRLRKTL